MKPKDIILPIIKSAIAMTLFVIAIVNYDTLSTLDISGLDKKITNVTALCFVILGVYVLKSVLFVVPASLVYVAVGVMLPHWQAVLLNLLGIAIEVSVTYLLGWFIGSDAVYKLLSRHEKGRKLLEKDIQNKPGVIIGIRAVPAFPIDFVSLFFGASKCNFPKYLLFSVLGISWRVILFTILGSEVFDWIPMDKIVLVVICLIPIGVAVYLFKKFFRKKTEKVSENTIVKNEVNLEAMYEKL